jgi:cell division septal protein FtsQ
VLGWGWTYFNLKTVTLTGNRSLPTGRLEQSVRAQLGRQWLGLGRNLITLDLGSLEHGLLDQYPEIRRAQISRSWPQTLKIKIEERQVTLGWRTGGVTYLLDTDGTIVNGLGEAAARLPVIEDSSNLPVKPGDRVVPARFVQFCSELVEQITNTTGLTSTELKVPDTTSELYVKVNRPYFIKFDTTRGASEQLQQLKVVLTELAKQPKKPAEYIDLRIAGKAYYK